MFDVEALTEEEIELVRLLDNGPRWFAVYTRPFHEKVVYTALKYKGIDVFLPTRTHLNYRRKLVEVPIFRNYLFARVEMRSPLYYQVLDAPGVVTILNKRGIPIPVEDEEIKSLQILVNNAREELTPVPSIRKGEMVIVIDGPLKGAQGVITGVDEEKLQFVVNLTLLGRSVQVKIDPAWVRKL